MYQRWPALTLDNAVAVTSDKRTRLRRGVKLAHGPARQARGAANSPTRDARPPLRARMRSPRVMIAAWFVVVALLFTGAPFWVCAIASVPFVVVVLFGVLTETRARRHSHRRAIGADPGPDEENGDNRSGQRTADDGARPSASLARPEDGVPAMPPRLQSPDDDEHLRDFGVIFPVVGFLKGLGSCVAGVAVLFAVYLVVRVLFPGIPEDVVSNGSFLTLALLLLGIAVLLPLALFAWLVDRAKGGERAWLRERARSEGLLNRDVDAPSTILTDEWIASVLDERRAERRRRKVRPRSGGVPAMLPRLQPPDDDELTRTPGVEPTRPRLRWTELNRTPGAGPTRPRPRWTAVRRFGSAVRAPVRAARDGDQRRADQRRADDARKYVSWAGISEPRPGGDRTLLGEPVVVFRAGVPLRSLIRKASR